MCICGHEDAYQRRGRDDYLAGKPISDNFYARLRLSTFKAGMWDQGWTDVQKESTQEATAFSVAMIEG